MANTVRDGTKIKFIVILTIFFILGTFIVVQTKRFYLIVEYANSIADISYKVLILLFKFFNFFFFF